jgi:tRNA G37 N-methylase TrmD
MVAMIVIIFRRGLRPSLMMKWNHHQIKEVMKDSRRRKIKERRRDMMRKKKKLQKHQKA